VDDIINAIRERLGLNNISKVNITGNTPEGKYYDYAGPQTPVPAYQTYGSNFPERPVTPTPIPSQAPTPVREFTPSSYPTPTPDSWNNLGQYNDPMVAYGDLIKEIWQGVDPKIISSIMKNESGGRIGAYHINAPKWQAGVLGKDIPDTQADWTKLRDENPSIDVGLMQINTAQAMTDYLNEKGWTYYDLLHDPKKNIQAAYDLYAGNIPYTSPGLGNWVAAKNLGYAK
jgi:hypothetical protein